ncbi:hypothetical protein EV44_g2972 [Erysiphe necator]|uniref:EGF-like domain-containing protein n=1 Tax=Uncinula necator TaxID=52586 RepID=A0A0B1P577_UNCNE|nr:hypothetical protein EV44_g2972 [Erysiphe necator]
MSDPQWQSSVGYFGSQMIGSSSQTRQILGTNQPRPLLLSPDKRISDSITQNRVKLQIPIGLVDPRNKKYGVRAVMPRPKQATQWSLYALRERERENIRRSRKVSQNFIDKNMAPRKSNRPRYIPSPPDAAKSLENTKNHQNPRLIPRKNQEDAKLNLNSPISQSSRQSSPTSSDGSIPDFPIPSIIGPARRSLRVSSPPSAHRAISSFYSRPSVIPPRNEEHYSSRTSSYHTYASSAALPSTFRGSAEIPMPKLTPKSLTSSNSMSSDWKLSKIEVAREYSLQNINNVGMAVTSNSDIELSKPKSLAASTYEKNPTLSVIDHSTVGARAPILPRVSLEHDFNLRLERFKDFNYSNVEIPSISGLDQINDIKTDESGNAMRLLINKNNADFVPETDFQKKKSNTFRNYRDATNSSKEENSQSYKTDFPDVIRRVPKSIVQIDGGKKFKYIALNDNSHGIYAQRNLNSREQDKNNVSQLTRLEYYENQNYLNDEKSLSSSFKFPKPARKYDRYCGLSSINFAILIFLIIAIIVTATFLPLFFFVFHKQRMSSGVKALEFCATNKISRCQNGGSSFLLEDKTCACICTNGFTGNTCSTSVDSSVCSSIMFAGQRALIGSSVKRLIVDAQKNFSVPLNAGLILARFNAASLSCLAENALVTFNGKSFREGDADDSPIRSLRPGISNITKILSNNRRPPFTGYLNNNIETSLIVEPLDNSEDSDDPEDSDYSENADYSEDADYSSSRSLESTTTIFVTITPTLIPPMTSSSLSEKSTTTVTVTITPSTTPFVPAPSISYGFNRTTSRISPVSSQQPSITHTSFIPPPISTSSSSASSSPPAYGTLPPSVYVANEIILDFARVVTLFVLQETDLNEAINTQISFQKIFSKNFLTYPTLRNLTLSKTSNKITVDLLYSTVDLGDGAGIIGSTIVNLNNTNNHFYTINQLQGRYNTITNDH